MRSRLFLFAGGILWLTGVLHAADFVGDPRVIPLHPTVIMSEYKNGFRPVVDVDRQDPQVDNEGELKQQSSKNFTPLRGTSFAAGSIELKSQNVRDHKRNIVYIFRDFSRSNGGTFDEHSDYQATLVSSVARKDCYIVILFFDPAFLEGGTDKASAAVVFQKIGDLAAGQEKKVSMQFGFVGSEESRLAYFPLFFSHGIEIRTNLCDLSAAFFNRMELLTHAKLVDVYRGKNTTGDHDLKAYNRVPVILPENIDRTRVPPTVNTSFMVAEDGRVEGLKIEDRVDPIVALEVRRALSGWLFYPRLKDGRPMRTHVQLPIELSSGDPSAG